MSPRFRKSAARSQGIANSAPQASHDVDALAAAQRHGCRTAWATSMRACDDLDREGKSGDSWVITGSGDATSPRTCSSSSLTSTSPKSATRCPPHSVMRMVRTAGKVPRRRNRRDKIGERLGTSTPCALLVIVERAFPPPIRAYPRQHPVCDCADQCVSVQRAQRHRCAEDLPEMSLSFGHRPLHRPVGVKVGQAESKPTFLACLDHERLAVAILSASGHVHRAAQCEIG